MKHQHSPTDPDSYFNPQTMRYDVAAYLADNDATLGDLYGAESLSDVGHNAAVMVLRNRDASRGNVNPSTRRGRWMIDALCLLIGMMTPIISAVVLTAIS